MLKNNNKTRDGYIYAAIINKHRNKRADRQARTHTRPKLKLSYVRWFSLFDPPRPHAATAGPKGTSENGM